MSDFIFQWVPQYGAAALFATLVASSAGAPLPGTLLLLAVGSLVSQGELGLWTVLIVGTVAAVLGDQIGYVVGRWGGQRALTGVLRRTGGGERLHRARALANRWGAFGIFITRWLLGPLGPWVNLSSGIASYPWARFLVWDVLGEMLWVVLFVMAGKLFSDRIVQIAGLTTSLSWGLVGVLVALFCAWQIVLHVRHVRRTTHPVT